MALGSRCTALWCLPRPDSQIRSRNAELCGVGHLALFFASQRVIPVATRSVAILVFDEVEVLDFCGPFEVFSVASRLVDPPAFEVVTVSERPGPVLTRGGLSVNPHLLLVDCPKPDLLLIPGGQGTRTEMNNPVVVDWVRQAASGAELILSVCTGALVLAKAGLLEGLAATTHHGAIEILRQAAPGATVLPDRRYVDNGRVICSAGIAAGIDMSLHVINRVLGLEVAEQTARHMEHTWSADLSGNAAG